MLVKNKVRCMMLFQYTWEKDLKPVYGIQRVLQKFTLRANGCRSAKHILMFDVVCDSKSIDEQISRYINQWIQDRLKTVAFQKKNKWGSVKSIVNKITVLSSQIVGKQIPKQQSFEWCLKNLTVRQFTTEFEYMFTDDYFKNISPYFK